MAAVRPLERASEVEPLVGGRACEDRARELFERHERRVTSFCRWRLGSHEEAEDAAQTTFLHAFAALRRGVVPVAEVPWLLAIARNVCLTRLDSTRRRARVEIARDPDVLAREAAGSNDAADDLFGLAEALQVLPEQQRRAILLREWKGLSYREIADELGVTLAAVETLIFRARRGLAGRLSDGLQPARNRLAGLLDAGALAGAVKSLVGGGAATVKVAAGVVAATGVVVAAGTSLGEPSSKPPVRDESPPAATATGSAPVGPPDVADVAHRLAPVVGTRAADGRQRPDRPRRARNGGAARPGGGPTSPAASATESVGAGADGVRPPEAGGPGLPDVKAPPVVPALETPAIDLPAVDLPDVEVPAVPLPEAQPPTLPIPNLELPTPNLPAVEVPPLP